jgi:hypothetical protein
MAISYILCSFGTFLPVLASRTKKNLATLIGAPQSHEIFARLSADPEKHSISSSE